MKIKPYIGAATLISLACVFSSSSAMTHSVRAASVTTDSGTGSGSGAVSGDNIEAIVQFDSTARNGNNSCTWRPTLSVTNGARNADDAINVIGADGKRRSLYARICENAMQGYDWVRDDAAPRTGTVARNRISKLLNMLLTKTAPPLDKQVVNVGTWFWVPKSIWKPFEVTAYITFQFGVISVTTTATPRILTYSPGDGHSPVSCVGPGHVWNARIGDRATSPCMYTYRSASHTTASRVYNSRMSLTWNISWRSNLGIGGNLPSITTGLNSTSRVFELQALAN
ncbi:MAG: hypothetical protein RLZ18_1453 [Actinomycetota bacterium]|jgi:hypothetical protein